MLSVVIPTRDDEHALVPTLASLVPGAADGLVRNVTIADGGSKDATLEVADLAGCDVVVGQDDMGARLDAAARGAKGPWLLFLEPGVTLEESWLNEARALIDSLERSGQARRRAAVFSFALEGFGARERMSERLAGLKRVLTGLPRTEQGLLVRKDLYEEAGGFRPLGRMAQADFVRRVGRGRIIRMRSRAINSVRRRAEAEPKGPLAALGAGLLMLRVPPSFVARLYG